MDNNMIFTRKTLVDATHVDRWGRMRPASLLEVMQETAGDHAALLGVGREQLDPRGLFWAIVRQTIEIHRLPGIGETVLAETWPGPPSRTAYPRYMVGRTPQGEELFRAVALWLLMDVNTRAMVLPSGSGIQVPGLLRGGELANPMGIAPGSTTTRSSAGCVTRSWIATGTCPTPSISTGWRTCCPPSGTGITRCPRSTSAT